MMPLAILLTSLSSAAISFVVVNRSTTAAELERAQVEELDRLTHLQTALLTALRRDDDAAVRAIIKSAGTDSALRRLVLADADGTVVTALRAQDEGRAVSDLGLNQPAALLEARRQGLPTAVVPWTGSPGLDSYVEICRVLGAGGVDNRSCWTLFAERDLSARVAATASGQRAQAVGMMAGTLLMSALLLWFFQVTYGRRTRTLVATTQRFRQGDESARARLTGDDELAEIGRALDRLLDDVLKSRSELAEAEGRRRHAQRLEALGQLTGGVAHDFNNYLAAILPTLEMAADETTDAELSELLGVALSAVSSARTLTRRLLAFAGRSTLQPAATDLGALVQGLERLLTSVMDETIEVAITLPDAPVASVVDPGELEAAIVNLAVNARDAMPNGGRLEVSVSTDTRSLPGGTESREWAVVSVVDTGVGMEPAVLERMFDPFYSTKHDVGGSGLGLSMVQGFVAQSGGFVSAESTPGHGASFRLNLPLTAAADVVVAPEPTPPARADGVVRVLVVEDNEAVRVASTRVLERLGYGVVSCGDADDALELLRRGLQVRLVLSDVVLPGSMSGIDLAAAIRAEFPAARVILATGYSEREVDSGNIDGLLHKPFDIDELASTVRSALRAG
jgi:signal transduction histidine kinase